MMMNARRSRLAVLAVVAMAAVAAPAAAQDITDAEIEAEIRDQCRERDSGHAVVDLVVSLPEDRPWSPPHPAGSLWGGEGGYLLGSIYRANGEHRGDFVVPFAAVSIIPFGDDHVSFRCAEDQPCIRWKDDSYRRWAVPCRSPERVIELLNTWIDRNVTATN